MTCLVPSKACPEIDWAGYFSLGQALQHTDRLSAPFLFWQIKQGVESLECLSTPSVVSFFSVRAYCWPRAGGGLHRSLSLFTAPQSLSVSRKKHSGGI